MEEKDVFYLVSPQNQKNDYLLGHTYISISKLYTRFSKVVIYVDLKKKKNSCASFVV